MVKKKGIFVIVILVAAQIFANNNEKPQNLVKNPTFQDQQNDAPAQWRSSTWGGQPTFEYASEGRTDSSSVIISSGAGADASWSQNVSVKPFMRYRLSGWIKTEALKANESRGALLNVHASDARTNALTGTNDWTRVECEFQSASDQIMINCLFGGWGQATGKAWYDDIRLEELGPVEIESRTMDIDITIDGSQNFEPISKYIYGQFIEHLGRCIYGGIWAEMLEDRKFFYPVPAEGDIWSETGQQARILVGSPWKVIGSKENVTMHEEKTYGEQAVPVITLATTPQGIYQDELAVIDGKSYTGRIVLSGKVNRRQSVLVRLVWGEGRKDAQVIQIPDIGEEYRTYPLSFTAGGTSDNARLEIMGRGRGSFRVAAVSLMPADNVNGFRKDTLALLKELDSPVYRWPGGNFVSGYDWRDGIGDRDKRPTRKNPAWTGIETNDVGIDEFIEFCRLIDTEPMIAVNTGFGDAYSAAAEVEYCNGSVDTLNGKLRAQNGHPEPYEVKWWCVGNEMFGRWQLGYMRLDHYTLKHNWVEEKMREVDPSIITIGVGNAGPWSEGMLRNCADHMDYLSEHFYCQSRSDITEHVQQMRTSIKNKCDAHRRYREEIPGLAAKDIQIAMDEWNYWYGPHIYGELGTRYFQKDALGIAAGLHEYFRNSDLCYVANYAQTVNVIGCIKTTKTEAGFATTAYPLMLYRRHFGSVPVAVEGWDQKLDVSAALTTDKGALTVGIVNATYDTYNVHLTCENLKPAGKASGWEIAHRNPFAYNVPGEIPAVKIEEIAPTGLDKIAVKPLSITLYKVKLKR